MNTPFEKEKIRRLEQFIKFQKSVLKRYKKIEFPNISIKEKKKREKESLKQLEGLHITFLSHLIGN